MITSALDQLARLYIGDGLHLNHYFVTDGGHVVTISDDFAIAYAHWRQLANRLPLQECELEDRLTGVIASVEPRDYPSDKRLIVLDDSAVRTK